MIDLDAIEARAKAGAIGIEYEGGGPAFDAMQSVAEDIPALVAEVRRLRAVIAGSCVPRIGAVGEVGAFERLYEARRREAEASCPPTTSSNS